MNLKYVYSYFQIKSEILQSTKLIYNSKCFNYFIKIQMIKRILNSCGTAVRNSDCFSSSQLFRFRAQTEHKTLCGGCVSIIAVALVILVVVFKLVDEASFSEILTTEKRKISSDPTPYKLSTNPEGNFMLAVEVYPHDLNQAERFFDVTLQTKRFKFNHNTNLWQPTIEQKRLQACKRSHFKQWPQIERDYETWVMKNWLCLPLNQTYNMRGSWMSDEFQFLSLQVSKCSNDSNFTKPCASQTEIDDLIDNTRQFTANILYVNPSINLEDKDYISYYLDDTNFNLFHKDKGFQGRLYLDDFQIKTDQSIIPMTQETIDKGAFIMEPMTSEDFPIQGWTDVYASFTILKSRNTFLYQRNVLNLTQIFILIAVIIAIILFLIALVNSYDKFAYQISLASYFFKPQSQSNLPNFSNFNFFKYVAQLFYGTLKFFRISPKWKSVIEYQKCQEEVQKQLDVSYLLDRIFFLESAVSSLLDTHQLKGLHLRDKLSLDQAKRKRRAFKLRRKVRELQKKLHQMQGFNSPSKHLDQFGDIHPQTIGNGNQNSENEGTNQKFNQESENVLKEIDEIDEDESSFSDISDHGQQVQENDDEEIEVLRELTKLREEASNGNGLSKKIWQITNQSLLKPNSGMNESSSFSKVKPPPSNRNDVLEAQNSNKIAPFLGKDKDEVSVDKIRPFKASKQGETVYSNKNT